MPERIVRLAITLALLLVPLSWQTSVNARTDLRYATVEDRQTMIKTKPTQLRRRTARHQLGQGNLRPSSRSEPATKRFQVGRGISHPPGRLLASST